MCIQSKLLTKETLISFIVNQAVLIYQRIDSSNEDGILIESAVYSAVRSVNVPIDNYQVEEAMQLARNKLHKYKI